MNTSFFITKIIVNFPGTGYDYAPIVYKYNSNEQIVFGIVCPNSFELDDPIKIHEADQKTPNGNSYITIATSRGQYQIYWNNVDTNFYILLQSLTSPKPYPSNQTTLWNSNKMAQNFTLNIDMTQLETNNGISLIPTI